MKVIFLDMDGVLVTWDSQDKTDENYKNAFDRYSDTYKTSWHNLTHDVLDSQCVERLNKITDATGAKIVISSTWRLAHDFRRLKEFLKEQGVKAEVVGKTPDFAMKKMSGLYFASARNKEIQAWLDENPEVSKFIILDDITNMGPLQPFLVAPLPTMSTGLLEEQVENAIKLLTDGG